MPKTCYTLKFNKPRIFQHNTIIHKSTSVSVFLVLLVYNINESRKYC